MTSPAPSLASHTLALGYCITVDPLNADTFETSLSVLIREVSSFQEGLIY